MDNQKAINMINQAFDDFEAKLLWGILKEDPQAAPLIEKIDKHNKIASQPISTFKILKALEYIRKVYQPSTEASTYTQLVSIASTVIDHHFSADAIVIALLHKIFDVDPTLDQIREEFGAAIAQKVATFTRAFKGPEHVSPDYKQENIDVLMVRLCDRLDMMQNLNKIMPEQQRAIALETIQEYLPLTVYLELPAFEEKLQQLCEQVLLPEAAPSFAQTHTKNVITSLRA